MSSRFSDYDGEPIDGLEFCPTKKKKKSLCEVFKELEQIMEKDRAGYYRLAFGGGELSHHDYAVVRAELHPAGANRWLFFVTMDPHYGQGADFEQVQKFQRMTTDALRKMAAIHDLVDGHSWTMKEVADAFSADDEK